jgi:dissimilatory sulfite reductase (desulfoviridin) alpha/beta subunit
MTAHMLTLVPEITPNGILIRTKMVGRTGKTCDSLLEPKEAIRWLTNIIELYKEAIEDDGY